MQRLFCVKYCCTGVSISRSAGGRESFVFQQDFPAGGIDTDDAVTADGAVQDGLGQLVDQLPLHQAFHRPGAVGRVVAMLDHVVLEGRGEAELYAVVFQFLLELGFLDPEDFADVGLGQRVEHDDFVDSVQEFGTDALAEHFQHLGGAFVEEDFLIEVTIRITPISRTESAENARGMAWAFTPFGRSEFYWMEKVIGLILFSGVCQ